MPRIGWSRAIACAAAIASGCGDGRRAKSVIEPAYDAAPIAVGTVPAVADASTAIALPPPPRRGTLLSILYAGNGQGEVEPCG